MSTGEGGTGAAKPAGAKSPWTEATRQAKKASVRRHTKEAKRFILGVVTCPVKFALPFLPTAIKWVRKVAALFFSTFFCLFFFGLIKH
jgi:hypothetical protein